MEAWPWKHECASVRIFSLRSHLKRAGDGNQLLWAADLRGESIAVSAKSCNQEEIQHPWSGNGAPPLPGQTDVRGLHVCYRFLRNTTGPAMSTPPITLSTQVPIFCCLCGLCLECSGCPLLLRLCVPLTQSDLGPAHRWLHHFLSEGPCAPDPSFLLLQSGQPQVGYPGAWEPVRGGISGAFFLRQASELHMGFLV